MIDTENSEESNLSSEKKAKFAQLNDFIMFVDKHIIEKDTLTEVFHFERSKKEYIILQVWKKVHTPIRIRKKAKKVL